MATDSWLLRAIPRTARLEPGARLLVRVVLTARGAPAELAHDLMCNAALAPDPGSDEWGGGDQRARTAATGRARRTGAGTTRGGGSYGPSAGGAGQHHHQQHQHQLSAASVSLSQLGASLQSAGGHGVTRRGSAGRHVALSPSAQEVAARLVPPGQRAHESVVARTTAAHVQAARARMTGAAAAAASDAGGSLGALSPPPPPPAPGHGSGGGGAAHEGAPVVRMHSSVSGSLAESVSAPRDAAGAGGRDERSGGGGGALRAASPAGSRSDVADRAERGGCACLLVLRSFGPSCL
jgi:hypothetical protein